MKRSQETPISNSDIEKNSPNRFDTVIVGAMRAREIKRGAIPKIATNSLTPVLKALEEIAAGKIDFDEYKDKLKKRTTTNGTH